MCVDSRYDGESCPDNGTPGAHREPGIDYGVAAADAHDVPRSGAGSDDGGRGDSGSAGDHNGTDPDSDAAD